MFFLSLFVAQALPGMKARFGQALPLLTYFAFLSQMFIPHVRVHLILIFHLLIFGQIILFPRLDLFFCLFMDDMLVFLTLLLLLFWQ
jgi:hypothetical protein